MIEAKIQCKAYPAICNHQTGHSMRYCGSAESCEKQRAVIVENANSAQQPVTGGEGQPRKLPPDVMLKKCKLFNECPATGKGHHGCYSEGPCFT